MSEQNAGVQPGDGSMVGAWTPGGVVTVCNACARVREASGRAAGFVGPFCHCDTADASQSTPQPSSVPEKEKVRADGSPCCAGCDRPELCAIIKAGTSPCDVIGSRFARPDAKYPAPSVVGPTELPEAVRKAGLALEAAWQRRVDGGEYPKAATFALQDAFMRERASYGASEYERGQRDIAKAIKDGKLLARAEKAEAELAKMGDLKPFVMQMRNVNNARDVILSDVRSSDEAQSLVDALNVGGSGSYPASRDGITSPSHPPQRTATESGAGPLTADPQPSVPDPLEEAARAVARLVEPEHNAGWGIYADLLRPYFAKLSRALADAKEKAVRFMGERDRAEDTADKLYAERNAAREQLAAVQQLVPDADIDADGDVRVEFGPDARNTISIAFNPFSGVVYWAALYDDGRQREHGNFAGDVRLARASRAVVDTLSAVKAAKEGKA